MRTVAVALSFSLVCAGLIQPTPAKAWGELGHLTVCDLAYRNLTPNTKAALKTLFNEEGGGITIPARTDNESRHYTSFNVGCLEEDSRPKKNPKDHFLNVDRSLVAIVDGNCPISKKTLKPTECIFEGIRRDTKILGDASKPRQDRVIALMAIGHWVGDLHQPLHVSYADDVGGNNIAISYSGYCGTGSTGNPYRPDNLHSVWDNCLLQRGLFEKARRGENYKPTWSQRSITYEAVRMIQAHTTLAEEFEIIKGEPWQWAAESYATARNHALTGYCTAPVETAPCAFSDSQLLYSETAEKRRVVVDAEYLKRVTDLAEDRVRRAGYRLAHLLNKALDAAYTGPIKNSDQPS